MAIRYDLSRSWNAVVRHWLGLARNAGSTFPKPGGSDVPAPYRGSGYDCEGQHLTVGHADFPKSPMSWV